MWYTITSQLHDIWMVCITSKVFVLDGIYSCTTTTLTFSCDLICLAIKEWFLGFRCIATLLNFLLNLVVSLHVDWSRNRCAFELRFMVNKSEWLALLWRKPMWLVGLVSARIIKKWIFDCGCYLALDVEPMFKLWSKFIVFLKMHWQWRLLYDVTIV